MEKIKSLPQDKQSMLEKWQASGKRIKKYCMEENIPYHTMSYWHRKQKFLTTGRDKKFIKIKLSEPVPSRHPTKTEIIYGNGNRIVFYGLTNVNELKRLAR